MAEYCEPYGIGLDIGIASAGWAALALDDMENPRGILAMGVRIFDAAENPKDGASLAAPRREARSSRRRLRRHRHRNERIRALIVSSGLLSASELDSLFDGNLEDIYELRTRALDAPISRTEFARILIHLSQRRGFKSNRKNPTDKEDGAILSAVSENAARMLEKGYRTVGEMLCRDSSFSENKRNKGGNYLATVTRSMVEEEATIIFSAQRFFNNSFASEELENEYLGILLGQRSFEEGPGAGPYSGNQIERMRGICSFDGNPRAAKASYSFEYFNLLQKINHLRILFNGESVSLSGEQRRKIIELAHATKDLNYSKIRSKLELPPEKTFNSVRYTYGKTIEEAEKKEKLNCLKAYHEIRTALNSVSKERIKFIPRAQLNSIGEIFTLYKTEGVISQKLADAGIEQCDIDALSSMKNFSKFGHLSIEVLETIIPFLEQGMTYNSACEAAGIDFKGHSAGEKSLFLSKVSEEMDSITSPVARRSISQAIKVINAIIRERGGSPTYINIELAREMSKDFHERKDLEKSMKENQAANERLINRIREEYGINNPSGQDLVKLKLFEEQGGVCVYSQKQMSLERIFDNNYAEVDHIVPYSLSFDDRYKNKVLVFAKENRDKGNHLPLQYLTGKRREDYIVWINNSVRDYAKRQLLLKEELTEDDFNRFKERNLQDTKTISVFLLNYIEDHLQFAPSATGRKKRVTAVNGAVTGYMRKRWGISKLRENGDLHHAVDAVVIGCTTDAMIQQVSRYAQFRECEYSQSDDGSYAVDRKTGEVLRKFPYPWQGFRKELEARLMPDPARALLDLRLPFYLESDHLENVRPLFVSRMPRRKVTGAAHKDTIKSGRELDKGYVVVKRSLTDLKLDSDGEIANYYSPESDTLLYNALKKRLLEYGGVGKQAFKAPFVFRKPRSDGSDGPVVKKVKLCEKTTLNVAVHNGEAIADHESMVRTDVFYVEGDGFYLIPIYVADTLGSTLPNKACVAHVPYSDWKEMRDDNFLFSLYPNDLIRVTHRRMLRFARVNSDSTLAESYMVKSEYVYFKGMDISSGSIGCINHDNTFTIGSLGVKTLESIEKYQVDVLGNYNRVNREKRQTFR